MESLPPTDHELADQVRQLVIVGQQIAKTLDNLQQLYVDDVRRKEEQLKESSEINKKNGLGRAEKDLDAGRAKWDEPYNKWLENGNQSTNRLWLLSIMVGPLCWIFMLIILVVVLFTWR
jgi:hypothetical protein